MDQSVPGANEANVEVVVENVQQNPIDAYTIGGALNNSLIFSEAPASGAAIYVIHKGEATYNLQPSTGSVTAATLDPVLRNFTVDNFTGNGSATTYTLTDTPYSANSILVTVDGIVQTATTNYTVSGTTLSFGSSAPDSGAVITVVHMGFSSGNKAVMDNSITTVKLNSAGIAPTITGGTINGATFAAGAVTTPSITTTGDTNTGIYFPTADTIAFTEGGTEAMRINSSGNVGIGTNSPNTPLQVNGTIKSYDSGVSNSNLILRNSTTGDAAGFGLQQDGVNTYLYNNSNGVMAFATNGTERMRLDNAGLLTLSYGQIKFPATQNASADANTLDDYEEGTFTPTATAGTPGGTPPSFSYDFRYTKIGRVVNIVGYFYIGNAGTASGNLLFTGFPFASPNNSYAPIGTATEQALTNQLCHMRVENNSTSGRVTAVTGGGIVWTTGGQYVISITYIAA